MQFLTAIPVSGFKDLQEFTKMSNQLAGGGAHVNYESVHAHILSLHTMVYRCYKYINTVATKQSSLSSAIIFFSTRK